MLHREITTNLAGREEVFNLLALGESTGLPVLLIGEKGTAKTQAALDYIGKGQAYVIQTSMGTRPNDIRGFMDMDSFLNQKKYRTISPITEADCIIIDEIDKTNDSVRDMLLSVMREKRLFLGSEGTKHCRWKLFVGCCNTPPTDTPFWDRFVLRMEVERLGEERIPMLFRLERRNLSVPILNGELRDIVLSEQQQKGLDIIVKKGYDLLSDRTISYLPKILRGVELIWNIKDTPAIVKTASLLNPTLVPMIYKELGISTEEVKNAFET